MLGKIVNNWLTSTDERGYQFAYAQLLVLRGHRIIHISSHGPTEFGKDIVTLGSDGIAHGFQLKVGDINLSRWRTEVRPEIEELLDLPIEHPSLEGGIAVEHESTLVTTGSLNETVALQIGAMNRGRAQRGLRPLHVVVGGAIERDLLDLHGDLPAWQPKDYQDLLAFLLGDGRSPLGKRRCARLLRSLLFRPPLPPSKNRRRAMIAKALVMMAYALETSRKAENHVAVAEGWVLLASGIVALAERHNLSAELWQPSVYLAIQATWAALGQLESEALESKDFLEGELVDSQVRGARMAITLGWVSAYRVSRLLARDGDWRKQEVTGLLGRLRQGGLLWGEAAVPYWVLASECARAHSDGTQSLQCVGNVLATVVEAHGHDKLGLPSPYYDANRVLRHVYARQLGPEFGPMVCRHPIEEGFNRQSFTLWSLVLLAARKGLRTLVSSRWAEITEVLRETIIPEPRWEGLLWRAHGSQMGSFPSEKQSWKELLAEGQEAAKGARLPRRLRGQRALLPLYAAAFPHRFQPALVMHLDRAVDEAIDEGH